MSMAAGTTRATAPTASTRHPARQPHWSITTVMAGVRATPASDTPMDAQPTAMPRFSTNHFDSVTLTTRLPISAAPAESTMPSSSSHCHSSVMKLMPVRATARMPTPTSMSRRPPWRSTWTPTKNPHMAMTTWPTVRARVNCERVQSRSTVIGSRNGPRT